MAGEWKSLRLGSACTKIGSGATPRGGNDVYLDRGPCALIRSQNVYNDGFHREGLAYIGEQHAEELANVEVRKGDVLLNITGDSVARACQVDPSVLPARVNQHVAIIRPDPAVLDPRFLRYFLVSPAMQSKLLSWAGSGGTRSALTKAMIESFELPPHDIKEQRAIAHILGTLDDKIELNRRMSDTLQAIADALFQSWFVDFDPIRANAEKRDSGLPRQLADLFPNSFEECGLGKIPKGWKLRCFGSLIADSIGGDWGMEAPDEVHNEPVAVIRGTDFPHVSSGIGARVPTRYTTRSKLDSRRLREGDIVIEVSGGSPTQPTGRSLLISQHILERFTTAVVCASFCRRLRPVTKAMGIFGSQHLARLYKRGGTWEYQNQSTGIANFQTTRFLESELVVWPGDELLNEYARIAEELLSRSSLNESVTLAALRDALLPKLISGDVRVNDAEKFLERIA